MDTYTTIVTTVSFDTDVQVFMSFTTHHLQLLQQQHLHPTHQVSFTRFGRYSVIFVSVYHVAIAEIATAQPQATSSGLYRLRMSCFTLT